MEHSFIKNVPSLYAILFNKKKTKTKKVRVFEKNSTFLIFLAKRERKTERKKKTN